jgi:hypothetical protein
MLDGLAPSVVDQAAPAAAEQRDALTRIRGIDDVLARRLAAIGIQRFAQISQWTHEDLRTVAQALGLGRDVLRHGVIEQASALEADRVYRLQPASHSHGTLPAPAATTGLTRALVRSGPTILGMPWEHGATWHAHAKPTTLQGLNGHDPEPVSAAVLARLHQGLPSNHVLSLSAFVPEIAIPVFIPSDAYELFVAPRWLPAPMLQIAAPESLATELPAQTVAPAPTVAVFDDPALENTEVVEVAAIPVETEAPLHEQAQQRLTEIEVLLEDMTAPRPVIIAVVATAPPNAPKAMRVLARAPTPQPSPRDVLRQPFKSPLRQLQTDEQEADVEIVTRKPGQRGSLLAPFPASPLIARHADARTRAGEAETPTNVDGVQEAAVVIVHRKTTVDAAALTAPGAAGQNSSSVRRFLNALAGS